jgi:hypothetical protein
VNYEKKGQSVHTRKTPDALLLPETLKAGARQIDRINSVLNIAEPILEVDRGLGERGYIRRQPGGRLFITKDPADTLLYPVGHPREGSERYRWSARPDGIELGYLEKAATHGTA